MRTSDRWRPTDYALLDTSAGNKLERWGEVVLVRPDPQIIWKTPQQDPCWAHPHATYQRSARGGGAWEMQKKIPSEWEIAYRDLRFIIRPTNFKHTGLFPEQAVNWDLFRELLEQNKPAAGRSPLRVLNLFAYTGGATMACAKAGAELCHVDASKGMIHWAKENAAACGLSAHPIRYIVDDCEKFIAREIRRGNRYDAVIMDPPSYGRGPGGEVWQLEEKIHHLLLLCREVLVERPLFFALNSYSTGLSPAVMAYLLEITVAEKFPGQVQADEIGLPVIGDPVKNGTRINILPCGSTALWMR